MFSKFQFMAILLLVITLQGCLASPDRAVERVVMPPVGMTIDPQDPHRGWQMYGSQRIHYIKTDSGWLQLPPVDQDRQVPDGHPNQAIVSTYRALRENGLTMTDYARMSQLIEIPEIAEAVAETRREFITRYRNMVQDGIATQEQVDAFGRAQVTARSLNQTLREVHGE